MKNVERIAWVDDDRKIISFHVIDNSKMITKTESLFWEFLFGLTSSGYRVM